MESKLLMAFGPGRYGANAEKLLREFNGKLCIVVMMGGPKGPAFDVATSDPTMLVALPAVLRTMADEIEADVLGKGDDGRTKVS